MNAQQSRTLTRLSALVCALTLAGAGVVAVAGSSSGATASGYAFDQSKTITRTNLINGQDQVAEQHTFELKVDKDTDLRNEEQVHVSWSGAHPTAGIANDPNSPAAAGQEYPMVLLECRGQDTGAASGEQVRPQTCWTISSQERYADDPDTAFPAWRLDRYETPADRAQLVGEPSPLPSACSPASSGEARRYVHFTGANGTDYPYGQSACAGTPPEATDYSTSIVPSNETYAVTGTDGTGSSTFDVWNTEENASLGCKQGISCALVAVPILGISCDADAASLPADDRPAAGQQHDTAAANCEANGAIAPGGTAGGNNRPNATVTGNYWWSQSNWRNRISVPLSFAPPSGICDAVSSSSSVDIYGSELMTEAMAQWTPHFCLDPKLFSLKHIQTGEPQAVNLLNTGSVEAAFDNQPPDNGYAVPVVSAPAALTGFAVSYQVDGSNGKPYANLQLTPRLLAKLLSESYRVGDYLSQDYPYLKGNPENLATDPEFQALNPGVPTNIDYQVASTILFASDDNDLMTALTAYINADPEARAWLNGTPDPWGMTVNPAYKGIVLPVNNWPLLDTTIRSGIDPASDPCNYYSPVPFMPQVESPVVRYQIVTQHLQFANPNDQVVCSVNQTNPQQSKLGPEPRQTPGHRFMIGLTTLADATRYGIPVASLETNTSPQAPVKFSDSTGRTFAGATSDAMVQAAKLLKPDATTNLFDFDYAAARATTADAGAYPGTMLVYTSAPTTGLPATDAGDFATFMRFTAGPGQVSGADTGDLAAGYVPLTSDDGLGALSAYTLRAADAVAGQTGTVPAIVAGAAAPGSTSSGTPTAAATSSAASSLTSTAAKASAAAASAGVAASAAPAAAAGTTPDVVTRALAAGQAPAAAAVTTDPMSLASLAAAPLKAVADSTRTPGVPGGPAGWVLPLLITIAGVTGAGSLMLRQLSGAA